MQTHEFDYSLCSEAFPTDPDFPQLKTASDPGLMLDVFRRHLKPVPRKPYQIQECIPFRFRFRQGTARCVLQYTLRLVEPATGQGCSQWVTGLIYAQAGEAERLCQQTQTSIQRQEIPEAWRSFEPVDFIPDLNMLVTLFPHDHKLPSLPRVMAGMSADLKPLLLDQFGPGDWQVGRCDIEPMRYRTELGAVVRYTIAGRNRLTAGNETKRFYLKVYRNQRGRETYQLLRSLAERAGAHEKFFSVIKPIAYLSELRTLVLEEAAGTSLQEVLLHDSDSLTAVRAVARAVAALNQSDIPGTRAHLLEDRRAELKRAAKLLRWACPQLRPLLDQITAAVVAGFEEVPAAPIHRDLKADHIFLDGERVIFVDLDSLALGDPVVDATHLMSYLIARVGLSTVSFEQARAAVRAFAEEYCAHVPVAWHRRLPIHYAAALVEVAAGIFRRQEPSWPETLLALVEQAGLALAGRL